jgi:sulfur carrier protein
MAGIFDHKKRNPRSRRPAVALDCAELREFSEMKLTINGEERDFPAPVSLSDLLDQLGMKRDRVAVERNHAIVPREQWSQTELAAGDRLEIVHFVGGGNLGRVLRETH